MVYVKFVVAGVICKENSTDLSQVVIAVLPKVIHRCHLALSPDPDDNRAYTPYIRIYFKSQ